MNPQQFEAAYGSVADDLAKATGLDRVLFLAQFALETGWGTSQLAQHNNLAGIKFTGNFSSSDFGGFAAYPSLAMFEKDYLRVIHLPMYAGVLNSAGQSLAAQMSALGQSPWDAGHYGNPPGHSLLAFAGDFSENVGPLPVPPSDATFFWYKVEAGDTLWALAQRFLGSGTKYPEIYDLNRDRIENPDLIETGQEIRIPGSASPSQNPQPSTQPQPTSTPTSGHPYVIKHGDTLWGIAVAAYGDGTKYKQIASANNITTPDLIFAGKTIQIP